MGCSERYLPVTQSVIQRETWLASPRYLTPNENWLSLSLPSFFTLVECQVWLSEKKGTGGPLLTGENALEGWKSQIHRTNNHFPIMSNTFKIDELDTNQCRTVASVGNGRKYPSTVLLVILNSKFSLRTTRKNFLCMLQSKHFLQIFFAKYEFESALLDKPNDFFSFSSVFP